MFTCNQTSECSRCWLYGHDSGDVLAKLECMEDESGFLLDLLRQRAAPFAPNNTGDPRMPKPRDHVLADWPGRRLPLETSARLTVVWDAFDARSAIKAKAVHHEFPDLCDFVEMHEPELETLLAQDSDLAGFRQQICREGGLSAVLACGVFISQCEQYPKALLFELLYRKTVRLPHELVLKDLQANFFLPLQQLCRVDCPRWWQEADALRLIAASLEANHFAIVDGLLTEADVSSLHRTANWFFRAQQMRPGVEEQKGGFGGYWGDANDGDIQNRQGLPCKWAVEGDHRSWVSDDDNRAQEVRVLTSAVDALVDALRDDETGNHRLSPKVTQRKCERLEPMSRRLATTAALQRLLSECGRLLAEKVR